MFCHYISVVVFVIDGLVYAGSHDGAEVFAWGTGSMDETTTEKNLQEQKQNEMELLDLVILPILMTGNLVVTLAIM